MNTIDDYLEYEHKVKNLLIDYISNERNNSRVRANYPYNYHGKKLVLDLVVLDENNKIIKVFEIKRNISVERTLNFIKERLRLYENATKADAFLAYLDEKDQLIKQANEEIRLERAKADLAMQKAEENLLEERKRHDELVLEKDRELSNVYGIKI